MAVPDLSVYRSGNAGIPYVWSFTAAEPGPHAVIVGLTHGNELCGAIAIDRLLRAGLRPNRGRASFVFANVEAFLRFNPTDPFASRCVEQDMNRLWSPEVLDGPGNSLELARARAIRPIIESADLLLDLHSLTNPNAPLALTGIADRGLALAEGVGIPRLVVVDEGHATGTRMRDHPRFVGNEGSAAALLVECGQHWAADTADLATAVAIRLLVHAALVQVSAAEALMPPHPELDHRPLPQRIVHVTEAVVPRTDRFTFAEDFRGVEVVKDAGTVIARDGETVVVTPYDNCVLILPVRRVRKGHTAVRLGRWADEPIG